MIVLTKRNHEKFVVNHLQIEYIECIPESKVVMMNRYYYLVRETMEEIIDKIAEYSGLDVAEVEQLAGGQNV